MWAFDERCYWPALQTNQDVRALQLLHEDRTDKLASEQWANQWTYYKVDDLEDDFNDLADLGYGEDE